MRSAMASNIAASILMKGPKTDQFAEHETVCQEQELDEYYIEEGDLSLLRTWKLSAMANEEISVESMRYLFRLLDRDGGSSLSVEEIKKGMILLGFPEAHDPVALGRLVQSIDEDQTGTISESEFLSFMSRESRTSLRTKMSKWSLQQSSIRATRYPTSGELKVDTADLSCASLNAFVRETIKANHNFNYWIEVVGYDKATFSALASAIDVSHEDLSDCLLFTVPVCRQIPSATAPAACIILHHSRLSVDPILPRRRSFLPAPLLSLFDAIVGGDSFNIKPPEILRGSRLANKDQIDAAAVTLEQAAILVISDRLVVTLCLPSLDGSTPPPSLSKVASAVPTSQPQWTPFSATLPLRVSAASARSSPFVGRSMVQAAFERLRRRLPSVVLHALAAASAISPSRCGSRRHPIATTVAQSNGDAKLLAVLLADCLVDSLHDLRDRMQDWDELLDASIRGRQCSANTIHLEAMDAVARNFKAILEPLAEALDPNKWAAPTPSMNSVMQSEIVMHPEDGIAPSESQHSTGRTASPRDEGGARACADVDLDGSARRRGAQGARRNPLKAFFKMELPYFKEMANDVITLAAGAEARRERVQEMTRLLSQLKQDMMNRTLYALTLVTFISTPVVLLTGTFGMNFTDMRELNPADPDYPEFSMLGYKFYAILAGSVVGCLLILLYRFGLFAALT